MDLDKTSQQQGYSDIDLDGSEQAALGLDYIYYLASPFFAGFKTFSGNDWKIFISSYSDLSPSLKNFFSAPETAQTIFEIGQKNDLEEFQIYKTASSTRDLLLGKIFIKDLAPELAARINVDPQKATQVVNDMVARLFQPIIEDIKRIQRSKFPDKIQQLQKESRPETLTQPGARPVVPRTVPTPGQQMQRPTNVPPQPQSQSMRPLQSVSQPQQMRPLMPSVPPLQRPPLPPLKSPEVEPQRQPEVRLPRPEFKVPDLDGIKMNIPETPNKNKQSLEAELEKVANVIDLRAKSEE